MLKDSEIQTVETSRSFTGKNPKIMLARALEQSDKGVRVTENQNIYGSYKIECSRDGLLTMSAIQASHGYRKLLEFREDLGDELTEKLMMSLARNIAANPAV